MKPRPWDINEHGMFTDEEEWPRPRLIRKARTPPRLMPSSFKAPQRRLPILPHPPRHRSNEQ